MVMPIDLDVVIVATAFTILGGVLGLLFMLVGVLIVPKILNWLTPNIDEQREIVRGNVAVAKYFGSIVQATIIGMSIIIGAAIIAGLSG